jgi:hypothetical protein
MGTLRRVHAGRTHVVRSMRVVIHATKEKRCHVQARTSGEYGGASGVLVKEIGHIMDETRDEDENARFGLLLD